MKTKTSQLIIAVERSIPSSASCHRGLGKSSRITRVGVWNTLASCGVNVQKPRDPQWKH